MAYVVMNVIDVPVDRKDEFEQRFAARAARVKDSPGFEAFELLKPSDENTRYIVYTRWATKGDFDAWLRSPAFAEGHRQHSTKGPVAPTSETWAFDVLQSEYD
jgi:heme-degrading monooxygenase HmoA